MIVTENKKLSIKKTLHLPITTVWEAWTEQEKFKKWWGPNGYACSYCRIDFKENGKYLNAMTGAYAKEIWSTGTYKEIEPFKKIVYVDNFADSEGNAVPASEYHMPGEWDMDLLVTVRFEEANGRTTVSIMHEGIPEEMEEDCKVSWEESLDKLERVFQPKEVHGFRGLS